MALPGVLRWLGAIPIDRTKSTDVVTQMVEELRKRAELVLLLAPEGTRKKVTRWKTGFYHIARGAGVPLVLAFLDYARKEGGIGPVVTAHRRSRGRHGRNPLLLRHDHGQAPRENQRGDSLAVAILPGWK